MKTIDISGFRHHIFPGNKPYKGIEPESEEQQSLLNELLEGDEVCRAEMKKMGKIVAHEFGESDLERFTRIVPVAVTPDEQTIFVVVQGAVSKRLAGGEWFAMVCKPDGVDELQSALDEEQELRKAQLDNTKSGMSGRN